MHELLYRVATILIGVSFLTFLLGIIHPDFLKRIFNGKIKGVYLAKFSVAMFFVAVAMTSIFNPSGLWQAKTDQSSQLKTEQHEQQPMTEGQGFNEQNPAFTRPQTKRLSSSAQPKKEQSSAPQPSQPIKKGPANICYVPGDKQYEKPENFTPYSSMQACLDSEGRQDKD